jgi:hypothetical protein
MLVRHASAGGNGRCRLRGAGVRWARLLGAAAVLWLAAAEAFAERGLINFCCMVPMHDRTRLATDVYLPRFPRQAYPIILVRTPDNKDEVRRLQARYVCRRGFGLVVQDTRGRYQSEGGETLVFLDDGWSRNRDGHDTIKWIARQPWCDGRVGTWGISAIGVMENMLAPGAPAALRAQHVMMAFSDMYAQAAYQGGVMRKSLVEGWLAEHQFAAVDLQTVLEHPRYDWLWADLNPEAQAARVNAPAVFWGGWYDIFLQGTINSFVTTEHQGGPQARGNCRLIIGPWSHGDAERLADPRNAGCFPRAGDPFRFFQHWLQGVCNGVPGEAAVHYYVMGDCCDRSAPGNCWRSADDWPPPAAERNYYFHADGRLQPEAPPSPGDKLSYRYDPADPVPTIGGQNLKPPQGPRDQRPVEGRDDVLLFTSEPLTEPVEVTGRIWAQLAVSSDCPDTDFTVKLTDVYPDGRSMLLCDGILRAAFRKSFEREQPLEPGGVYQLKVDLWSTSIVLNKGHRIRVAVSSSNAPRFEPNPNTGQPHLAAQFRVATNTVHLSKDHPSYIILPICRAAR